MNGKPITDLEKQFIADNYVSMTDYQLSIKLERPFSTICVLRAKLGFLRNGAPKPFTKEEADYVVENYKTMSNGDMGLHLNRTPLSIVNFMSRNKLKRQRIKSNPENNVFIEYKVNRMLELIKICETTQSLYVKDKAVKELKQLSGLK